MIHCSQELRQVFAASLDYPAEVARFQIPAVVSDGSAAEFVVPTAVQLFGSLFADNQFAAETQVSVLLLALCIDFFLKLVPHSFALGPSFQWLRSQLHVSADRTHERCFHLWGLAA